MLRHNRLGGKQAAGWAQMEDMGALAPGPKHSEYQHQPPKDPERPAIA